ncbi:hypothetical protein [Nostoc sp. NMS9]|uniref:hypothetical protein n=1 Tax=Nostoc sp. NMS9 TaxID=2815393 RepID=UPI0025EF16ED|nr:hypothetical protein [Nostoc sp. NMS9]MBN3938541.1 hypothetical protein [Nostoc sp. NMS9]
MTDDSTITHEAFKQFERNKFSVVAQEYNRALAFAERLVEKLTGGIAVVTSQVDETILDAVGAAYKA